MTKYLKHKQNKRKLQIVEGDEVIWGIKYPKEKEEEIKEFMSRNGRKGRMTLFHFFQEIKW